jgi:hypothetical protein
VVCVAALATEISRNSPLAFDTCVSLSVRLSGTADVIFHYLGHAHFYPSSHKLNSLSVGFEVPTAVVMKSTIFWDITP